MLAVASAASLATLLLTACGAKSTHSARDRPAASAPRARADRMFHLGATRGLHACTGSTPQCGRRMSKRRDRPDASALSEPQADAAKAIDSGPWTVTASPTVGPGGPTST